MEYAVQYSVAAAYATFDQNKKDLLHKLLLQGNAVFLTPFNYERVTTTSNFQFNKWISCAGLDITILGSNDFYSYRNEVICSWLYTSHTSFFSSFLVFLLQI